MEHVLTLIADPAVHPLAGATVAQVRAAVRGDDPIVLSPGEAVDIHLPAPPT